MGAGPARTLIQKTLIECCIAGLTAVRNIEADIQQYLLLCAIPP